MATAKKSSTAKKSTTVKRKAPAKKKVVRRSAASMQSFRMAQPQKPFLTFEPTIQTVYWLVLGVIVIAFTSWIMMLQADIQAVYDQIDANNAEVIADPVTPVAE